MEESSLFYLRNRLNTTLQFWGYCSEDYVKLSSVRTIKEEQSKTETGNNLM